MRRITLALLSAGAVAALTGTASAHVTVNPREATQGGFAKVAFRVPNERDDAATTKVEVSFPPEQPLTSVSVRPQPGWTATLTRTPLATPLPQEEGDPITDYVSKITWAGGRIEPGQFQEFEVSVGRLPADDRMIFRAVQTYSSGEVVSWIEVPAAGGSEPEHPAPILTLKPAASASPSSSASNAPSGAITVVKVSDVDSARLAAYVGIGVGAFGLLVALVALAAARRSRVSPPG